MDLKQVLERPDHVPLMWSNGLGVNSAAVACQLVDWGLKPSQIMFADTGGELPETYSYLPVMNAFLTKHGYPEIAVIRRESKYQSLEDNCLANDTLPGIAFGHKSCSMAWKVEPMNRATQQIAAAVDCWDRGSKVIKIIGYDYGERDSARFAHASSKVDDRYDYWYPLREAKLDRDACKSVIRNAGLPVPPKSACFFCPASRPAEIRKLVVQHPELAHRAMTIELNALQGKHGLDSTAGLGRSFSWIDFLCRVSPALERKYGDWLEVVGDHRGRRYHYCQKTRSMLAAVWGGVVRWNERGFTPTVKYKSKKTRGRK